MHQSIISIAVTGIFNVIATIVNAMLTPLITFLLNLFPDLSARFIDFNNFLTMAFTYLSCILQWLLFTPTMFVVLFDYFAIKFSMFVIASTLRFILNIYDKLKP